MIAYSNSPRRPREPTSFPISFSIPFSARLRHIVASWTTPTCTACGSACLSRLTIYQLINENYALAKLIPGPFLRVLARWRESTPCQRRGSLVCDARARLRPQRAASTGGAVSPRITGYLNEYRN